MVDWGLCCVLVCVLVIVDFGLGIIGDMLWVFCIGSWVLFCFFESLVSLWLKDFEVGLIYEIIGVFS